MSHVKPVFFISSVIRVCAEWVWICCFLSAHQLWMGSVYTLVWERCIEWGLIQVLQWKRMFSALLGGTVDAPDADSIVNVKRGCVTSDECWDTCAGSTGAFWLLRDLSIVTSRWNQTQMLRHAHIHEMLYVDSHLNQIFGNNMWTVSKC